ncbi:MAG: oligosaccharide flippase family protein, partial [Alistipes sp.]|nr:oligosaccharide flippase family protein [Alistipes sp.]
MQSELKQEVARGTGWTLGEKVATALVQFVVRILILRLLLPDDLKVLALLMAFGSLALVVVDSGFSQMLVRKAAPTGSDYKSVFLFNLTISALLYGLLTALAPWLADFYAMPAFEEVAALFFLMIPLNALCVIQQTIFTRQFRFALLSKVVFASQLTSGVMAVVLAWMGCGVWALVAQQVLLMGVRALLLWWLGSWRPQGRASLAPLREMAPYSLSLLASDLVTALYNKVPQFFLGKMYLDATLGYYDQAVKLKDLPVQSTMQSVQQVTFPALSRIADEQPKFGESFRQLLMVVAYGIFPV